MFSSYFLLPLAAVFGSAGLHPHPQHRIIGGRDMDIEEAPWQVSVLVNGRHNCGGSIYSEWIIITAAHCFFQRNRSGIYHLRHNKEYIISAGSELKRGSNTLSAASTIMFHENFTMRMIHIVYDIGIMKLHKPFRISNQVKPIRLAIENPAPGSELLTTGWGTMVIQNVFVNPEILQGIYITLTNVSFCKKFLPSITKDSICAGTPYQSICQGDSGGPLVFNNTLVGVVAGGTTNCFGPGIYTSVVHHHKWLMKAISSILFRTARSGRYRGRNRRKTIRKGSFRKLKN